MKLVSTLSRSLPGVYFTRLLDSLSSLGVGIKINVLLLGLGLVPPLVVLLLLHQPGFNDLQNVLALYIAAFVLLFYPLGKAMEELIVLRQTRRINTYVEEVKAGRRTPHFDLPREKGNEHDFVRLQRNIFWMVQGLKTREARLRETLNELGEAQRRILESIEYASLIQRSFLPSPDELSRVLGEHFLLWLPRDGVGGDAYWVKATPSHAFLAVFDCTGHGVPGAFLTLIVSSLFEQEFDDACCDDPGLLLSRLNRGLKLALSQNGKRSLSDDGLEGAVCCVDRRSRVLHFAAAKSYLFLLGEDGISEFRGDRSSIGFVDVPMDREFTTRSISLNSIRGAYLFTDGITDQIGGPKRLPFGRRRLLKALEQNAHLPLERQHMALERDFAAYRGRNSQRDDVTVLGFSIQELLC